MKILHGPQADIQIEHLAQGDVERTDAAAHWRGQGAFDPDEEFVERLDSVVGEPVVEFLKGGFTSIDFKPGHFAFAGGGLLHGGIEDASTGRPNIGAGAVAADEGNDGIFRDVEFALGNGDFAAGGRYDVFVSHVFQEFARAFTDKAWVKECKKKFQ